ncbi:hypothetical protein HN937_28720 [Candidatus Poribacteria bacterium]|jgi:hypothetical protein|nr:hypothetical protein [Candidatus Poribacteria bacterium]
MINASLKIGDRPSANHLLAGFVSRSSPFMVDQLIKTSDVPEFRRADATEVPAQTYYKATVIGDSTEAELEYRSPYRHAFPPLYSGGSGTTRMVNVLVTHEFDDGTPLFYVSVLTDEDGDRILMNSVSTVRVFRGDEEVSTFSSHHSDPVVDGDKSVAVYVHRRESDMWVEIEGKDSTDAVVSYRRPLYLVPALRWVANAGALSSVNDVTIVAGEIFTNSPLPLAIAYGEHYDFEQAGFPYFGVDYQAPYGEWRIVITSGSFVLREGRGGNTNIFEIGTATVPKKLRYATPLTPETSDTFTTGFPIRTLLGVYDEDGVEVTVQDSHLNSGWIRVATGTSRALFADVTVIDWFEESSVNGNLGPTFDTNYWTNGLAKKDRRTGVWLRPGSYVNASGVITAYGSAADFEVCYGNEIGWQKTSAGVAIDLTDYTLFGDVLYPTPQVDLTPAVFRGEIGTLFGLNAEDLRGLPLDGIEFDMVDALDVEKRGESPIIRATVPEAIRDLATHREVVEELRKFVPLGHGLVVEYK